MAKTSKGLRIVGEIKCPGWSGGTIYPVSREDFCDLGATLKEAVLKEGCTITFRSEPKPDRPTQGSLFPQQAPKGGQRSLFGRLFGRRRSPQGR